MAIRVRAIALGRNRAGRLARRLTGPYTTVFAGDCAGTILCAWIGELLPDGAQVWACAVPWTTLAVNLADTFLLRPFMGLLACRLPRADPRVHLLLGTSFLGSFATYGTFTAEVETATTTQAATYAAGSVACALLCAWGGLSPGTRAGRRNARQRSVGRRDQLAGESELEASAWLRSLWQEAWTRYATPASTTWSVGGTRDFRGEPSPPASSTVSSWARQRRPSPQ